MVKRSAGATIFQSGKEYVYKYTTTVHAGSSDYVSFASAYNISGTLHIQANGNTLNVKLDEVQFGAHNGEFKMYPSPQIPLQAQQELNPLSEPFQVTLDNGKVVGVALSNDVPEFFRNIQRGIASGLQLDLAAITLNNADSLTVTENTIMGECKTDYLVVPLSNEGGVQNTQIRKYRSHEGCANLPRIARVPGVAYHDCRDAETRDTLNSSAWSNFDLEMKDNVLTAKYIAQGSSVAYFLFGPKGLQQYSFAHTIMHLLNVNDGGSVPAPSNPQNSNSLVYVHEYKRSADEDLTKASPFYNHIAEIPADIQDVAAEKLDDAITKLIDSLRTTGVYKDLKEFHSVGPIKVVAHIGVMNYDHLKHCYEKVKADADPLKKKVFLDAVVISGTGPAALLIRDIVKESDEPLTIARLFATLPAYLRNPTENVIKEFEAVLKPQTSGRLEKVNGRIIDLAFASLINRVCKDPQNNGCQASGLLEKYVKYYSDRFDNAPGFEEQTAAVAALRNIGLGGAAEKLLEIVKNRNFEDSVRVQALPGLKYLLKKNPEALRHHVLPIFFDRSEHCELRSVAAKYVFIYGFNPQLVNQVVIYMWSEKSPLVKNYIYTLLQGVAASTRPCIKGKGSYARSALAMFPPYTPNPKFSANYLSDYYDPDFHFGQMTDYVVHKVGTTFLPTVAYVNLNGAMAGFGNSYLTVFVRLEGLGKAVTSKLMDAMTQITKFDDIKNVFQQIGVVPRKETPLKLELGIMIQNRVVTYHAADRKSLSEIPGLIQKITQRATKSYEADLLRMTALGGVMIEQPNEFGTPVTALSSATGILALHAKVNRQKQGDSMSQETDMRTQMHLFGLSGLSNHLNPLGAVFSVTAHRTLRVRAPRHVNLGIDVKQMSLNVVANVPKEDDPALGMVHASVVTSVMPTIVQRYKNNNVDALLAPSNSKSIAVVSKGEKYRESRQVGILYKYLTGVKGGIKYFDCEKVHNRAYVAKQLRKIFGPENKNDGGRVLSRLRLGLSYLRESLFFSPITPTCGIKAYFYQDASQETVFDHVEGNIKAKYTPDPNKKVGTKITAKATLKMVYTGAQPKSRNFDANVNFQVTGVNKRDLRVKLGVKDEITNKNGIVCMDVSTVTNKVADWFSYEGPNEPTAERTINIIYGSEPKDGKEGACPDPATSPSIKYTRKSHRSQGQIEEATGDFYPYKQCREQRASGLYPGPLVPATEACAVAAFEQTKLREANITVEYKVHKDARNRWSKPGALLAALLLPYYVPEESTNGIDAHADHHGAHVGESGDLIQGRIELDAVLDETHPEVDIHFHPSTGAHEHYHGIDLTGLPTRILTPISTRFQPLQVAALKMGVYAYCDVTTGAVQTFDNNTYAADLSECPTLISGDCSSTPRYAVYARKIAADRVGVTVQLAGSKIELTDTSKATVDGTEVPLSDDVFTLNEKKIFKIVKFDENNVFIFSNTLGVYVRYTGYYTTVTAGSRYRGTNCGVCGNFNDNKKDDFVGPDPTCNNLKPQDMFKAYIVREGSCAGVGSACPTSR